MLAIILHQRDETLCYHGNPVNHHRCKHGKEIINFACVCFVLTSSLYGQGAVIEGADTNCSPLKSCAAPQRNYALCHNCYSGPLTKECISNQGMRLHIKAEKTFPAAVHCPLQRTCNNECVCFELDKRTKFSVKSPYFNCKNRKKPLKTRFSGVVITVCDYKDPVFQIKGWELKHAEKCGLL